MIVRTPLSRDGAGGVVIDGVFSPPAERRSLLDRAHRGDIEGALGRVRSFDTGPRVSIGRGVATLLAVAGPGLIVTSNDAGGLSLFGQAGQDYGLRFLWLLPVLALVLFVNQEMVARLGAATGAGHARLIFERFGRRWGMFAVGDLLLLNLLTIVTEFIGVSLALGYFGISPYLSVPLTALALIVVTATGSFRRWERVMLGLVAANVVALPLVILSHPHPTAVASAAVPGLGGAVGSGGIVFVVALVGNAIAPWQLFFQQSSVVDKRITPRWLSYERTDTLIGTFLFTLAAAAILVVCAVAFDGTALHGNFVDAGTIAHGLATSVGSAAGALFALLLLNASVLGAALVTLATSYAVGDVSGCKHSLHRKWRDARAFHGCYATLIVLAAGAVLVPSLPLGIVTTLVQALAGVLLPSATVFLVLLANDRPVLGPGTNPRWLNALATAIVGILLVLSGLLIATTLLPRVGEARIAIALLLGAAASIVAGLLVGFLRSPVTAESSYGTPRERASWTMPPIDTLPAPVRSRARTLGLTVLRVYLLAAATLLVIRGVEIATGG
jgi:Mn2+/Fe2+ NRAMP family transporter